MCGKCEPYLYKSACGALALGVLFMILAAVSKLAGWGVCGLGPKSFAWGAELLLLYSIAVHACKMACPVSEGGEAKV